MKNHRRLSGAAAIGLTAVLASAMAAPGFASTTDPGDTPPEPGRHSGHFTDNPRGSAFYTPVRWMARHDISVGYTDNTFRKNQNVTRGETTAFLYRYIDPKYFEAPDESPFSDINVGGAYYSSITWASAEKVTAGYADGTFKTSRAVTRGEFAAFLYRWDEPRRHVAPETSPFEDLNPGGANYDAITWLAAKGITVGDTQGNFNQSDPITRGEISAFMQRYHAFG